MSKDPIMAKQFCQLITDSLNDRLYRLIMIGLITMIAISNGDLTMSDPKCNE